MNRILEIAAMALGGLSLFAVCFLGFATMAGVPLHQVAGIGRLFPEPPEAPETADGEERAPKPIEFDSDSEVYERSLGVLSAWSIESPFTAEELKTLADELKLKREQLKREISKLEDREGQLDAREDALVEQFAALDDLRAKLEAYEADLMIRAEEVARDEAAEASRNDRKFQKLAELFKGLEPRAAMTKLKAYPPEEATKILLHMNEKTAVDILNSFTGDDYLLYGQAWAEAAGETL